MEKLIRRLVERYTANRPPGANIGPGYLLRWFVIPRNKWFNIYLHCFQRSDDDRALHDHPWYNFSILLLGQYIEHTPKGAITRKAPSIILRRAVTRHRVELPVINGGITYCWTLFITGPRIREWGFHCPQGWIHWKLFTDPNDKQITGKGCDQ